MVATARVLPLDCCCRILVHEAAGNSRWDPIISHYSHRNASFFSPTFILAPLVFSPLLASSLGYKGMRVYVLLPYPWYRESWQATALALKAETKREITCFSALIPKYSSWYIHELDSKCTRNTMGQRLHS